MIEDADGSLLVVDTGGWYKLCCPTSQLVKPDVLGAIYRIRRTGTVRADDPRGLKLDWKGMKAAELAKLLDDPRPAVRRRAIQTLAKKNLDELRTLHVGGSPQARRNFVWSMTRIPGPEARDIVRQYVDDADETVRQAALHSISVWRDKRSYHVVGKALESLSPQNRRAAAESLGRLGLSWAIPSLLEAAGKASDRTIEHSAIYALIEINDQLATAKGLDSGNPNVVRAALTALDQMQDASREPAPIIKALASPDAKLKETASWIVGRHPEWGESLHQYLRERLAAKELSDRDALVSQLASLARSASVQKLLGDRLGHPSSSAEERRTVLKAMSQARLKETPAEWWPGIVQSLAGTDPQLARDALVTVRTLSLPKKLPDDLTSAARKLGQDDRATKEVRLLALAVVPEGMTGEQFALVRAELKSDRSVASRSLAADILLRARLGKKELLMLAQGFADIGPMELDRILEAFAHSGDDDVGRALLAGVKAYPARSALRSERLRQCLAKFSLQIRRETDAFCTVLDQNASKQQTRLEELLGKLEKGDIRRGQAVFNGTKGACASCHAIGYLGGKVGPDLTHIGKIRNERDLLESIVFPSASFVRSYEPIVVVTKDGKSLNGIPQGAITDEVTLILGANQEVRIRLADIEEMQPSRVSIMPSGLDQQLTPRELADLLEFLKACK